MANEEIAVENLTSSFLCVNLSTNNSNSSNVETVIDELMEMLQTVLIVKSCLLFIGVVANATLITTVLRRRALRESPTFVVLVSLALADSLLLVTQQLGAVIPFMEGSKVKILFCKIFFYMLMSFVGISSSHLVLFSAYRFIAVVKPFFTRRHITVGRAFRACVLIWSTFPAVMYSLLTATMTDVSLGENVTVSICSYATNETEKRLMLAYVTFSVCVPLLLIPTFHISKLWIFKKRTMEPQHDGKRHTLSSRVVMATAAAFVFCWAPLIGIFVSVYIFSIPLTPTVLKVFQTAPLLINVQSAIDPFLYFFLSPVLRRSITCSSK